MQQFMIRPQVWLFLIGTLSLTAGCPDSSKPGTGPSDTGEADSTALGSIQGRVCHPSGTTWLQGALVYTHLIDDSSALYDTRTTYTNIEGRFTLNNLPGLSLQRVYVQYGDTILWDEAFTVGPGETVEIEEPTCLDTRAIQLAVVTGDRDITPSLNTIGITEFQEVDGKDSEALSDFLLNPAAMSEFSVIIFDAGHTEAGILYPLEDSRKTGHLGESDTGDVGDTGEPDDPDEGGDTGSPGDTGEPVDTGETPDTASPDTGDPDTAEPDTADPDTGRPDDPIYDTDQIIQNIREYVEAGGSIYAVEWAYDTVELSFPDAIEFLYDDTTPDAAQQGLVCELDAKVVDPGLEEWAGSAKLQVSYPLGEWPVVETTGADVYLTGEATIEIEGEILTRTDTPLLVSFEQGEGTVVLSTFRVSGGASTDMLTATQYMMILLQSTVE